MDTLHQVIVILIFEDMSFKTVKHQVDWMFSVQNSQTPRRLDVFC